MYTNYNKNITHPFTVGELVSYRTQSWHPLENWIVTKATFYHGHSGYADRWELRLVSVATGRETKTTGDLVDLVTA